MLFKPKLLTSFICSGTRYGIALEDCCIKVLPLITSSHLLLGAPVENCLQLGPTILYGFVMLWAGHIQRLVSCALLILDRRIEEVTSML